MKINTITDLCTGCRTCEQLCPKHCITMEPDHEGFLTAYIDEEKCIKCGLCRKRCPQNIDNLQNAIPQKTYAVRLKDEPTLYKSASGGAFAGLAICVIENGGIVYGARYDENLRVFHSKAKTIEEVIPQLSSKYVQSDTEHTYTEVKEQLAVLYERLKPYENHPYERRAFYYLDILSWLESKMSGLSVATIIRRKFEAGE